MTSLTSHTCVMLRKMWGWGWGKKNRDGISAEVHRLDRRYVAFMESVYFAITFSRFTNVFLFFGFPRSEPISKTHFHQSCV